MVSTVSPNTVDLAQLSRAQAAVPLAAEAQAFLAGPSLAQQREAESPSPFEVVQSTNSPVDGRTLIAAQETSTQNDQQSNSKNFDQSGDKTSANASTQDQTDTEQSADGDTDTETATKDGESTPANPQGLTEKELKQVQKLKKIDREVRQHERAHQNSAPELTGTASFKSVRGPDGKLYAVAGEVSIDTGEAATPEATIQKLKRVIKAALAPQDPSAQDRKVAAQSRAEIAEARGEIREEKAEERQEAEEAKQEREAKNQGGNSTQAVSPAQPDLTNAIQAFQAAAALSSTNQPRPTTISV